jgi:hypothetical protein
MDFRDYPEFLPVEEHIRRAKAERAVMIAHFVATLVERTWNGIKRMGSDFSDGLQAERDRRAIEADAFLKRAVPRY